jgi:hypothetical protein
MKSWCIKNRISGHIFKILLSEEDFQKFLRYNSHMDECIDCIECDDAPSIVLE